jgi:hypothetical protein
MAWVNVNINKGEEIARIHSAVSLNSGHNHTPWGLKWTQFSKCY